MSSTRQRPLAHISVADASTRPRIVDALHRQGWSAIEQPTGFHVLQAIADVIEGRTAELPALLVVDAIARGCSGTTIAAGLRELGVAIPLVLVTQPGARVVDCDDANVRVIGPSHAVAAVAEIARALGCAAHGSEPDIDQQDVANDTL